MLSDMSWVALARDEIYCGEFTAKAEAYPSLRRECEGSM
jgi:hypothetical protein